MNQEISLREIRESDFEAIHSYACDPDVCRFELWGPNSVEDTKKFFEKVRRNALLIPRKRYDFAITLEEKVIGTCSLHHLNYEDKKCTYSIVINKAYWGKGLGTQAIKKLTDFTFNTLKFHRLFGSCDPDNPGSLRAMEKAGLEYEGRLRENVYLKKQSRFRDTIIYSVINQNG